MDIICEKEAAIAEIVQNRFLDYTDFFITISKHFDPQYAFVFLSPLVFSLDWKIGKKLMWVVVTTEWINHILKWLLHGERPYWWIHETGIYNKVGKSPPNLYQFDLTCETSPGLPSGHSQTTAAVWYVIFDSFLEKYNSGRRNYISKIIWLVYLFLLATITASRVFIAAHFPHQCVIGLILGWFVARKLRKMDEMELTTIYYFAAAIGMFISAFMASGFLKMIGSNPMWTLDKAKKWCKNPVHVRLSTTPLYSMMRYCGFMFGMAFAFSNASSAHKSMENFTMPKKILNAFVSVGICLLSEMLPLSTDHLAIFYFQACILNALRAFVVVRIVPQLVTIVWSAKDKLD